MTLVAFASLSGAPGVTTLACLVGASWPNRRPVLLAECDPKGGDLAARFRLSTRQGWATLAASGHRSIEPPPVTPHVQQLPGGLDVLVGARAGDGTSGGSPVHASAVRAIVHASQTTDIIVDLGRLLPNFESADAVLHAAEVTCIVARPDAASVMHVRDRTESLVAVCGRRLRLVVVGRGAYSPTEIERFSGIPVVGRVPYEPTAAAVVAGEWGTGRRLARSSLIMAARRIGVSIAPDVGNGAMEDGGAEDCAAPTADVGHSVDATDARMAPAPARARRSQWLDRADMQVQQ